MGSIHLFYDTEVQDNRLSAQTFADMLDDNNEYLVPTLGEPTTAWTNMLPSEQRDSIAFTHAHCCREDTKDRCLNDSVVAFSKELKTSEKDMTTIKE